MGIVTLVGFASSLCKLGSQWPRLISYIISNISFNNVLTQSSTSRHICLLRYLVADDDVVYPNRACQENTEKECSTTQFNF